MAASGRYDAGKRRRAVRAARQRGVTIYVPAEELVKAGFDPAGDRPWYRVWGSSAGGLFVRLYRSER